MGKEKSRKGGSLTEKIRAEAEKEYQEYLDTIPGWVEEHVEEAKTYIPFIEKLLINRERFHRVVMAIAAIYLLSCCINIPNILYQINQSGELNPELSTIVTVNFFFLMFIAFPGLIFLIKKEGDFAQEASIITRELNNLGFKFQKPPNNKRDETNSFVFDILKRISKAYHQLPTGEESEKIVLIENNAEELEDTDGDFRPLHDLLNH